MQICLCLLFFALCCCTHVALCDLPKVGLGNIAALQVGRLDRQIYRTLDDMDAMIADAENDGASSDCQWDVDICVVSDRLALDMCLRSKSGVAALLIYEWFCSNLASEKECKKVEYCSWMREYCAFVKWQLKFEDSPCVKAAPATFEVLSLLADCGGEASQKSCDAADSCSWYGTFCAPDFFKAISGTDMDSLYANVTKSMSDYYISAVFDFMLKFRTTEEGFVWERVLEWEIRKLDCPPDKDKTLCDATFEYAKKIIPVQYYCSKRYTSQYLDMDWCMLDPYCEWTEWGRKCTPSKRRTQLARNEAMLAAIRAIKSPVDRQVWTMVFGCDFETTEKSCINRGCTWRGSCEYDNIFSDLAKQGEGKKDGFCTALEVRDDKRCRQHTDVVSCKADEDCHFTIDDCVSHVAARFSVIFADEPELLKEYMKLSKKCKESTSEATCGKKTALNFPVA